MLGMPLHRAIDNGYVYLLLGLWVPFEIIVVRLGLNALVRQLAHWMMQRSVDLISFCAFYMYASSLGLRTCFPVGEPRYVADIRVIWFQCGRNGSDSRGVRNSGAILNHR